MNRNRPTVLWLLAAALAATPDAASAAQSPYHGTPYQLPTTIEAEDYDHGGEGVAYHDTTPGNVFGVYRTDGMDVGAIPAASGGGHFVGFLADGEWAEYTVNVPATQAYEVRLWLASNHNLTPNTFHLELDGIDVTGPQVANYTAGWHNYVAKTIPGVWLTAGSQRVLRVSFDTGAWNLDRIEIRGRTPWSGLPVSLPGVIEAENYDRGGQGIAYHDTTPGNVFGQYRTDDMDVGAIPGGGFHVGFTETGEWAEYSVSIAQTRAYELAVRVASADTRTVRYRVALDGQDLTGAWTVPHTGGWHSYIEQVIPVGTITAGASRVLRVSFELNGLNLDRLELRAAGCTAPVVTSQPVSQTVSVGGTAAFSVAATGTAPLQYQWSRNGVPIPGAVAATLSLTNVQPAAAGGYSARVSNACGASDSNTATLTVALPPCVGPEPLEQALADVLRGLPLGCDWSHEYKSGFPNVMGDGSYNEQVLAAAIAAIVSPNLPGPDTQHAGVRGWWRKYLRGELGERGQEWAFGGKEPFAHVYHHFNLASVMAMNYEFRRRGWTTERDLARRWLRASWALMAAAATDKPLTHHDRTTVTPVTTNYSGPWVATAGMRTWWGSWVWVDRNVLYARAVGAPSNLMGEPGFQRELREFLEAADNGWNQAVEGDVYGLTPTEKSSLAGIRSTGQLPPSYNQWIAGVRTVVPYHIVAWPGVRVTLMRASRNNNTSPTYGIAFFSAPRAAGGREAHFLYPWNREGRAHRNCVRHGSAAIDPGLTWIEATSGPAPPFNSRNAHDPCTGNPTATPPIPPKHPEETVRIDGLPGGTPQYHIALPPWRPNW